MSAAQALRGLRDRMRRVPHPAFLTVVLLFAAYFAYVAVATRLMPLNSDKVWVQTVLALHGRFGSTSIDSSPDTFALKYPLYVFANHVFGLTFRAAAFEVFVDNLVLFASVAISYGLLVRSGSLPRSGWPLVGLVALWTISVCDPTGPLHNPVAQPTVTLIHPNERNLELGLAILVLVVTALLDAGRIGAGLRTPGRFAITTGLGLAAGVIWFDDPYNAYLMLVPLGAVAVVRAVRARPVRTVIAGRAPWLWYFLALAALSYFGCKAIARALGLHPVATTTKLVPLRALGDALHGGYFSLLAMYDGSGAGGSVRLLLNAVLAVVVVVCGLATLPRALRTGNSAAAVIPLAALVIAAAYIASGSARSANHVRYLIVFVPIFLILLPGALAVLGRMKYGRQLVGALCGLLVVSGTWNVVHTIQASSSAFDRPDVNAALYARAGVIGRLGLAKGYATYWNAQVTTYVSRTNRLTIPVRCHHGLLRVDYWLIDSSWLNKPATQTYLIRTVGDPLLRGCRWTNLVQQFGQPVEKQPLPGRQQLLVYDYDIATRMPKRPGNAAR